MAALPPLPVELPRQSGPATVTAAVRDLDPAVIPGSPAGLSGHLSLDLEASAARPELAAVEGRIGFPQLELAFNRLTLTQQEPSRISIEGGKASVEHLSLTGTAGTVTASGTVGLAGIGRST